MYCFLDYRCSNEEIDNIVKQGLTPIIVPKTTNVYDAINGHVDIQMNIISKNTIIIHKSMDKDFCNTLDKFNIKYIFSNDDLKYSYPGDIILNGIVLDNYFIHNLKYTDKNLLDNIKNKSLINVKQGYSKCSVLIVNQKAIITSDKGIANALRKENFDVLLIPPGDIILPSMNYGFIGGTGGLINNNTMAFFGDLQYYAYGREVYDFLYKYDVKPIYLSQGKLIDRGSIYIIG